MTSIPYYLYILLDIILPMLTKIVNNALQTATMPQHLKEAMVRPTLKKDSLDFELCSNFRPISNLKFLSNVIENVVACQLHTYLKSNGLEKICTLHIKPFIVRRLHLLRYKVTFCVQSISNIVLFFSSLTYQRRLIRLTKSC